jgi:hypothetical protein
MEKPPDYQYQEQVSEGVRKLTDIYMRASKEACAKFEQQRDHASKKYQQELANIQKLEQEALAQIDNNMICALSDKLEPARTSWFKFW